MLNGNGNESGIKVNRSNQQKRKKTKQIARAAHFFLISKKTNLHVQHAFCLSLPFFWTTATLFCRTKSSNALVTHYFYGGIVVCASPQYFVSCVHVRLYFSLLLIFTLLAARISHCLTAALNFHVFLPTKFVSFICNHWLQLFLCYPRECKHQK